MINEADYDKCSTVDVVLMVGDVLCAKYDSTSDGTGPNGRVVVDFVQVVRVTPMRVWFARVGVTQANFRPDADGKVWRDSFREYLPVPLSGEALVELQRDSARHVMGRVARRRGGESSDFIVTCSRRAWGSGFGHPVFEPWLGGPVIGN